MAKPGFDLAGCRGCLRSGASASGWALCIGAGASDPIFPRWGKLVEDLLKWNDKKLTPAEISNLFKSLSLESLIQSVFHRKSLPPYQFAQVLTMLLYAQLKSKVSASEWSLIQRLFANVCFANKSDPESADFLNIIATKYPNSTPLYLAEVLGRAIANDFSPSAVLSFNAEPLLLALTNAYIRTNTTLSKKKYFDASLRGISYRKAGRIPFHFCHGLLPLPGQIPKKHAASLDKLIFSESEYLNLASSNFSWQSAVFLNAAMSHSLVFVGLSFTDQNLRRWLGFVHTNRINELQRIGKKIDVSTRHYWINKRPATLREQEIMEAATAHLGVRLVWIDNWSETRSALENMLTL